MGQVFAYLKDYKKECIIAPLFKMLEVIFELFVPLVVAGIIDYGIFAADKGYIWKMGGLLVVLATIGLSCTLVAQYFAARAAVGFSTKLKSALFAHIQALTYSELDTAGAATLITRMTSDVNALQTGVNWVLRLFLRSPCVVLGATIMAFTISVRAALIFVVVIVLLSLVIFGIMLRNIPMFRSVQNHLDSVLGLTRENLTGARVIRAFQREEDEIETFEARNQALMHIQMRAARFSALMNPATYLIINTGLAVLIWRGAIQVSAGSLSQGEVVALVNYLSQILVELIKLANVIIMATKALASGRRIQAIFDLKPSFDRTGGTVSRAGTTAVSFDHVGFTYANAGAESLSDLTFSAQAGDVIGVIGGTGSGKSTLVNLIPRFYDATRGEIRIFGRDVRDYPAEQLRDIISVVPQKAQLFKGTIRSNLLWGAPEADEAQIRAALESAQAAEFVFAKEDGLDEPVEQGGRNLSGGQRQRLTIARALVTQPDILILDDSASALDYATEARLRRALRELPQHPTVFIVSQRTASLRHADRIIVLDDGRAVGIGTHEELLRTCPVYAEIDRSQSRTDSTPSGKELEA
ncbi:MAG: ABC transporter ATP-binding protein [Butyricicoccaceae bacterium]